MADLAQNAELNSEVLVRAVRTRWNTVTMTLQRAKEMKDVLTELCDRAQFNTTARGARGMRLRSLILPEEEWEIIDELHRLLDVRRLFIISSSIPCS